MKRPSLVGFVSATDFTNGGVCPSSTANWSNAIPIVSKSFHLDGSGMHISVR